MQKTESSIRFDALDRAELEEHILVLRLLMSRTYARETHFGQRRTNRADFLAIITKYTGRTLPNMRKAMDEDCDDDDCDDDQDDGSLQRCVYAACQPALRAAERALRVREHPEAIDELCNALARTLRFTPTHKALFRLAIALQRNMDLRHLCKQMGMLDEDEMILLCSEWLDIGKQDLQDAFETGSPILSNESDGHDYVMKWLYLPKTIEKRLREKMRTGERLLVNDFLDGLFNRAPPAKLELAEFPDPAGEIGLLQRYLAQLRQAPRPGVNILLFGPPGTGKTQLSRALCQSLGITLFEVPTEDSDRDVLTPQQRLAGFRAAQANAQLVLPAAVHFDEFEDVFPCDDDDRSFFGWRKSPRAQMKGWINQLLETNSVPAIWVGNSIDGMDAAYLRRFDMIVEVKRPRPEARARMVHEFFKARPLPDDAKRLLTEDSRLSPAHLERVAMVLETLAPDDEAATGRAVRILRSQIARVLREPGETRKATSRLRYRAECTMADAALDAVIEGLARTGAGRFCLYGPPGTGKTAWVHHVAECIGKSVILKRASDLLSPYVGETEHAIRAAFDEAEREMAVLLIDEADSFLRDRHQARANWEVTQVNELLTNMERYEGIFFASTNLFGDLDEASLRRFDFKIRFGYMQAAQARQLLIESLRALGQEPDIDPVTLRRLERLDRLTPGDFASVVRRFHIHAGDLTGTAFVDALAAEIALRRMQEPRKVGFV